MHGRAVRRSAGYRKPRLGHGLVAQIQTGLGALAPAISSILTAERPATKAVKFPLPGFGTTLRSNRGPCRRPVSLRFALGQQLPDYLSAHVGQAIVAALEAVRQAFVVEAEQVQDRGLEVVDVDRVASDAKA